MQRQSRVYLDNNATTKISRETFDILQNCLARNWGNPSASYQEGRSAANALEEARRTFARFLNVQPDTVYFTSCGTESNNIAIRSVMQTAIKRNANIIITSSIEHPSVHNTASSIPGCVHITIPVDDDGRVVDTALSATLKKYQGHVGMVCIIAAHNEFGTLQDIPYITRMVKSFDINTIMHTDATQLFGRYPRVEPYSFGVDTMTASAHKFHGLKGVGILYARHGAIDAYSTIMTGGGQEHGIRSGTENVPAIVASAHALTSAIGDPRKCERDLAHMQEIKESMWLQLRKLIPGCVSLGDSSGRGLRNTLCVLLPNGAQGHDIVNAVDDMGVSISSGSACCRGQPSRALTALLHGDEEMARRCIRISLCSANTEHECIYAVDAIASAWRKLRAK